MRTLSQAEQQGRLRRPEMSRHRPAGRSAPDRRGGGEEPRELPPSLPGGAPPSRSWGAELAMGSGALALHHRPGAQQTRDLPGAEGVRPGEHSRPRRPRGQDPGEASAALGDPPAVPGHWLPNWALGCVVPAARPRGCLPAPDRRTGHAPHQSRRRHERSAEHQLRSSRDR